MIVHLSHSMGMSQFTSRLARKRRCSVTEQDKDAILSVCINVLSRNKQGCNKKDISIKSRKLTKNYHTIREEVHLQVYDKSALTEKS